VLAAVVTGSVGCGSARTIGVGAAGGGVTLAGDVQPIFTANCAFAGCHGGAAPQFGMDLTEGRAAASTVNVDSAEVPELKRILPGDSANSYLYQKITQDPPLVGDPMPVGGSLTAAQKETIRQWIDGGAMP
jgi:hypothetical protein